MAYPIRLGEEPTKKRRKKKQNVNTTNVGVKLIDDDLDVPPPIEPELIKRGQKEEYSPERLKRKRKRIDSSPKRDDEDNDFDDLPRNNYVNVGNDDDDLSPPRKRVVKEEPDDMDDLPRTRVKREDSDDDSRVEKSMQIHIEGKVPTRKDNKAATVDPKQLEKEKREWALGTAQKRELEQKQMDYLKEIEKPFSRSVEDKDLEDSLKAQVRFGDPMANYGKKSKKKKSKQVEKPKYNGPPAPPNRFNIPPGFRWDGVDRTNGFEKRFFKKAAERKALKEVAYKWSVEDM